MSNASMSLAMVWPSRYPITLPITPKTAASAKNSIAMWFGASPTELNISISCSLSCTDPSMVLNTISIAKSIGTISPLSPVIEVAPMELITELLPSFPSKPVNAVWRINSSARL